MPGVLEITRFTPRRKAELVHAIATGAVSDYEVMQRYSMSPQELLDLKRLAPQGRKALRVTKRTVSA
jgi:hypothetical protein